MIFEPTTISDVIIVKPNINKDERGFFMETYHRDEFSLKGIDVEFIQDNHSGSEQGVLRGLHYQIRKTQGKLVRAVTGKIFDVAVDLRKDSPTIGKWVGVYLSGENKYQLWIPEGFAHGYYTLSQWADVVYKVTDYYAPEWDRTLRWNDPEVGIEWPLVDNMPPRLSDKDARGKGFLEAEKF